MDNPLTPNKIQRLIHLAEDKSFTIPRRFLLAKDEDLKRLATANQATFNKSNATTNRESSTGILDLDRLEGFGECGIGELSSAFNPVEMTGRSTGAEDMNLPLSRHSIALDSITSQMDKQTFEIQDIMRHSIATNYSFHSKRDLSADEASLIAREAPLPVQNNTQAHFTDSIMNKSDLSVGAYFKIRCSDFGKILTKTDSPVRANMPSIIESISVSTSSNADEVLPEKHPAKKVDQTLDCVPVKQPRNDNIQEKASAFDKTFVQTSFIVPKNDLPNETANSNIPDQKDQFYLSQVIDKPKYIQMTLNSMSPQKNAPVPTNKDTDSLIKNLHASLKLMGDDTEGSTEESFSISKIADYLGKQSNVSITDMMQYKNQRKQLNKKLLTHPQTNVPERNKVIQDTQVVLLKDSQQTEASSSGTVNTVILSNKYKQNDGLEIPSVLIVEDNVKENKQANEEVKSKRTTRSKSPSSKSQSTLSTVQENCTSFKSGDSPLHPNRGEINTSQIPSPNIKYKELDKSVDWQEVMHHKRLQREGLAKERWVEISATTVNGYVGAACQAIITITTLADSWLTAKLQFDNLPDDGKNLTIELPRMPLLLSPGKSERITFYITSAVEIHSSLDFTIYLKDTSIDGDIEQKGVIELNINMPVIQAMSSDGVNQIAFPPVQENTTFIKSFVLISDCSADLQLEMSVVEGDSIFTIKNVQEIKKSDVNKVLMDRQGSMEEGQQLGKAKSKSITKQFCILTPGNAIRVTMKFKAPKLSDMQRAESTVTFKGLLNVNFIGGDNVLRKVDLIGVVGNVKLVLNTHANKFHLSHEPSIIEVSNEGSVSGIWTVKFSTNLSIDGCPIKITPSKIELRPGSSKTVNVSYTGSSDAMCDGNLIFEEISTGQKTSIEISCGSDKPKLFPIKTNYNTISWVRPGRKELSLKNVTDKKIYIRCHIVGDGFAIDLPRESRGIYYVPFGPCECRPLPIIFTPPSNAPYKATLHLAFDKNSDFSRKILLFGCASGESMHWSGLVTYGDAALVRAVSRMPINMELYNKSQSSAFVCARIHFNLQYMWLSNGAQLEGARHVVQGRTRHILSLRLHWARLERRARFVPTASTFGTLTVLTGAEATRQRILKIVRDESNGELDTSLLPDHLKVLAERFDGQDDSMAHLIDDFKETKASLNELIGGLQELTAHIDLPQDFAEENTILISDDSTIEHHTLCD